jgi:hypothetical protein
LEGWYCWLELERIKGRVPYKGNGLKNGLKCSSFLFLEGGFWESDEEEKMEDKECAVGLLGTPQ